MSSYGSNRGRMFRPNEQMTQSRNPQYSGELPPTASSSVPVPQISRSQIARPAYVSTRNRSASSASDKEDSRRVMTPRPITSKSSSNNDTRPSLLPRPTGGFSSSLPQRRLSTGPLATGGPMQPPAVVQTAHAPSNSSKLGSSSKDRPRNVLRRKAPFTGQNAARNGRQPGLSEVEILRSNMPTSSAVTMVHHTSSADAIPDTNLNRAHREAEQVAPLLPSYFPGPQTRRKMEDSSASRIPKELAGLSTILNTHNLPPPTPNFASASSPSTRYSESPGLWSRGSTPTSLSSYSPGIVQPTKIGYRLRQPSPTQVRLPVPSRSVATSPQTEGIEFGAPSSQYPTKTQTPDSSSGLSRKERPEEIAGTKGLTKSPAPPRSPPPRKSSMKFRSPRRTRSDDVESQRQEEDRRIEEAERRVFDPRMSEETTIQQPEIASAVPPSRPSRKGTDRLELKPSPVIKSNLPFLRTTGHKRRESADEPHAIERPHPAPLQPAAASVESFQSRSSSRIPSHAPTQSVRPTRSPKTLTKTPPERKEAATTSSNKRFGIFAKKSTTDLDRENTKLGDRATRKGPSAGTGHEGYGRYAQRGRRTSIGSASGTRGRSTSTTRSTARSASSSKSSLHSRQGPEIDGFLLDRLEPVVISGGGMDGAELLRTRSEQSVSSLRNASTSNLTAYTKIPKPGAYSTGSLVPSTGPSDRSPASDLSGRDPSPLAQAENQKPRPTLGKRLSFRRSQLFGGKDAGKPTLSSDTKNDGATSRAPSKSGSSSASVLPEAKATISVAPDERGNENTSKKPALWTKNSKWNFFQRSHGMGRREPVPAATAAPTTELHAAISPIPGIRTVPHYALLDASSDSLEDILHRVEESPPTEAEETESSVDVPAGLEIKKQHESVLLPSPPALHAEYFQEGRSSPKVYFRSDAQNPEQQTRAQNSRPSRLASVGRIPQVVSRRDRQHKPALHSFSRPFSHHEAPSLTVTANYQPDRQYTSSRPALGIQTDVLPSRPFRQEPDTAKPFSAPVPSDEFRIPAGPYSNNEFLAFSPRKGSEVSGSSSSEGKLSLAAVTAVVPDPGSKPTEDEVWNEYDDLIDNVLPPESAKTRGLNESETGEPFELATKASKTLQAELNAHGANRAPSNHTDTDRTSARSSGSSVRLRRSRIASALHSSITPSTQMSFSELIGGYGDRNKDSMDFTHLDSPSTVTQVEQPTTFLRSPSLSTSRSFETSRHRNTVLFDLAERDREGAIAQANLRSGSLMTSRWLSFGRVLFSPAHNYIKSRDQERILVIDGLGNDDWSFYCALTYPTATVYSLTIGPAPSPSTNPAAWQPPANHHTIHHASADNQFPFPKGFFAASVLRFPAACSDAAQRNIISECKRVLRPGGYLEMSILDLDLVNMGNRARKMIRMLKERICLADPEISLKPASDSIQRLLGRRGFENLYRCMVGIPVAGMLIGSSDSSASNPSVSAATATTSTGYSPLLHTAAKPQVGQRTPSYDAELSLGDLLSDPSPSASNDESIAKIVAKVGRWWYTRCYELPILPEGDLDRSIWADRKLLRECQKRGTGFRLLIAYAQKPSEVKRRTASV